MFTFTPKYLNGSSKGGFQAKKYGPRPITPHSVTTVFCLLIRRVPLVFYSGLNIDDPESGHFLCIPVTITFSNKSEIKLLYWRIM